MPRSWAVLKPKASIATGSIQLVFAADTPGWNGGGGSGGASGVTAVREIRCCMVAWIAATYICSSFTTILWYGLADVFFTPCVLVQLCTIVVVVVVVLYASSSSGSVVK